MALEGKFTLEIQFGNASMRNPRHLVKALRDLADRIENSFGHGLKDVCDGAKIMDANGNSVGRWEYSE